MTSANTAHSAEAGLEIETVRDRPAAHEDALHAHISPREATLGGRVPMRGRAPWQDGRIIALGTAVALYVAAIGYTLTGAPGAVVGLVLAVAVVAVGTRIPAETMLALYRAKPLSPGQGAALREAVETTAARAGLASAPAIAIVPSLASGAFAVGTGPRTAILFTEGLLRRHSMPELAAIAAHEIAHIRAGDMATFALADTMTRLAQAMFYFGLATAWVAALLWVAAEPTLPWKPIAMLVLAPMASSLLQLSMPRKHDLVADMEAARLIGDIDTVVKVAAGTPRRCGSILDDLRLPVPQRRAALPSPLRASVDGPSRAKRLSATAGHATGGESGAFAPLAALDGPLISLAGVGPIEMRPRNRWPGIWF